MNVRENTLLPTDGVLFKVTRFFRNILGKGKKKTGEELILEVENEGEEEKNRLVNLLKLVLNEEISEKDVSNDDLDKIEALLDKEIFICEQNLNEDKEKISNVTKSIKKINDKNGNKTKQKNAI